MGKETSFVCGYCGKEYSNANERGACEVSCYAKEVEKVKREKAENLKKERQNRIDAINSVLDCANEMIVEFNKDYNSSFPVESKYWNVVEEIFRRR